MKLNYAEGSYNPSFFYITIKTDEELSQNVIEKNELTFVHEFIHYLQDLILPYNIRYNLSNVCCFFNILEYVHRHGSITLPFNEWTDESRTLLKQFERSIGGITENVNDCFVNEVSEIGDAISDFIIISGFDGHLQIQREHRVYRYFIPVYKVGDSIPINYNLGARDILEYIAYKIELKHFPNSPQSPQLPYKSIDLIFDKYGLSNISDDIRLCIAERCLYNDTPIHFLLYILLSSDEFKRFINTSSYKEIYNYLLFSSTMTRDGHSESLISKTQRRLKQFSNELLMQYRSFNEIGKWILKVNDFVERKLSGRFIFSDMYKMGDDEFNKFINSVIYFIGIPLVMNSNEKYISIQFNEIDASQFIQFYIMQNFISFAKSKTKSCPIYNFCKENCGKCNENCLENLHMSIKINKNCYLNRFLESYGLSDCEFNYR